MRVASFNFTLEDEDENIHLHFSTGRLGNEVSISPEEIKCMGKVTEACI